MRHCVQCGHPLEDGERFCNSCGTAADLLSQQEVAAGSAKYCAGCGALLPGGQAYCPLCGSEAGRIPEKPAPNPTSITDTLLLKLPAFFRRRQRKRTSVAADRSLLTSRAFFIVLLLVAGIAAIAIWQYLPLILPGDSYPLGSAVLYVKEAGRLILNGPDASPYEITDQYDLPGSMHGAGSPRGAAAVSADGRYLAYRNADKLQLLDLTRLGKTELQPREGILIDDNVFIDFHFARRGHALAYLKTDGALSVWRESGVVALDENVLDILDVGERHVLYTKQNANGDTFDLYLQSLDSLTGDRVLIAGDIFELLDYTRNYSAFLYSQRRGDPLTAPYTYEIGYYDAKNEQTNTLASGVTQVLDASAEKRMVAFIKEQPFTLRYDELVDDPLAETDVAHSEPDYRDYNLPEDYEEIYELEGPDTDSRQAEIELEDLYYEDYLRFRKDTELFEQKLQRDAIRAEIHRAVNALAVSLERRQHKRYGIFLYQDGASHPIDETVLFVDQEGYALPIARSVLADIDQNSIAYLRSRDDDFPRLRLEDWPDGGLDLIDWLYSALPQELCWAALDGSAPVAVYNDLGADQILSFSFTEPGDKLCYITAPRGSQGRDGTLSIQALPIVDNAVPALVDVEVSFLAPEGGQFNGALLYGKSAGDGRIDLYTAVSGQNPALLAEDVSFSPAVQIENGGKTLLYYRMFGAGSNQGYDRGELYLYINQERMIIGDVYDYDYRGDRQIYLVRNQTTTGLFDLQLYREGGVTPIDTGVIKLIPVERNG